MRLWQSSGRAAKYTVKELGLSTRGRSGQPSVRGSKEALQAKVERLQRELARMTEQRDILKKAVGILSEPPPSGMF